MVCQMTGSKRTLMSLNTIKTNYINFTAKNKVHRDMADIGTLITSTNHKISRPDLRIC
jgi:hypothetical protein